MSETLRTLGPSGLGGSRRRVRRRGRFRLFLLLILLALFGYGWWITRDTQDVARLIPADRKYWLVVSDVAGKREKAARSEAIDALSQWIDLRALDAALNRDIDAPDWVVNNLVGQTCYITGDDLEEFKDVLLISKMTRLGTLLERLHGLVLDVEEDPAGGLGLRRLADPPVYFASRGRVLVISPDRDALIRSLTLRTEDSVRDRPLGRILGQTGSEDLQGSIALAPEDPLGSLLSSVGFALRLDPDRAKLKYRAALRPDLDPALARLLDEATPQTLTAPEDGMLVVSADLGKPVRDVWTGLGDAFGWKICSYEQWTAWRAVPEDGSVGMATMLTAVLEQAGPGFCIEWRGIDVNEIFPMPELVGVFDRGNTSLEAIGAAFARPEGDVVNAAYPQYDAQARRLVLPLAGGPSLKPTAVLRGDSLVVSTSSTVAEDVLKNPSTFTPRAEPGNLYVRLRPGPCVDALIEAARLLVEMDALRGYTPETFEEAATRWRQRAASIAEVSVHMAVEDGQILGEVDLATGPVAESGSNRQDE